jgi:hypothetical protein
MGAHLIDLVGKKFGRLIVLERIDDINGKPTRWLCRCNCNKKITVLGYNLKNGNTKSCGCLKIRHGHRTITITSPTYQSWRDMIQRCTNLKYKQYHYYGGRGITVCKKWRNSFEIFLEDMGETPKGCQIDRINNDGNYCKENCRWITPKKQARNRRNNLYKTYKGKTQLVIEWAEEYNIPYGVLSIRLYKLGWSMEKALITSVKQYKKGELL